MQKPNSHEINIGDVVYCRFPVIREFAQKNRPALVVEKITMPSGEPAYRAVYGSSQRVVPGDDRELIISGEKSLSESGLEKPTRFNFGYTARIFDDDIIKVMGHIRPRT